MLLMVKIMVKAKFHCPQMIWRQFSLWEHIKKNSFLAKTLTLQPQLLAVDLRFNAFFLYICICKYVFKRAGSRPPLA